MKTPLGALFIAIAVIGCVAPTPRLKPMNTPFNESEFEEAAKLGTGKVVGSAFLKTRSGEVKLGAGNEVVLVPVNAYTTEIHTRSVIGGANLATDPGYGKYRKIVIAGAQGDFEFTDIKAGDYYLGCKITWEVPTGGYGTMTTGGVASTKVTVKEGETVKAVLTR